MTKEELIKKYVLEIKSTSYEDLEEIIEKIIVKVNELVYEQSKNPISNELKVEILDGILDRLSFNRTIDGQVILNEQFDNKAYLDMLKAAINKIKGNK